LFARWQIIALSGEAAKEWGGDEMKSQFGQSCTPLHRQEHPFAQTIPTAMQESLSPECGLVSLHTNGKKT